VKGEFPPRNGLSGWTETEQLEEVTESFVFVLKPDSDHHARVALAAYAESVSLTKPRLGNDLRMVLATLDMAEGVG
jgi:hypothetical protein